MRPDYARKMAEILHPKARLMGVFFDFPLTAEGPPFGGDSEEYLKLFAPHFKILHLEPCRNSIKPRLGRELFVQLTPASLK